MIEREIKEKIRKYKKITEQALEIVSIKKGLSEKEKRGAREVIEMAKNYFSDAKHFEEQGGLVLALAAFSYSHAWLDAGVRLKLLDGRNNSRLFTLPKK